MHYNFAILSEVLVMWKASEVFLLCFFFLALVSTHELGKILPLDDITGQSYFFPLVICGRVYLLERL